MSPKPSSASEMAKMLGKKGLVRFGGFQFRVVITDVVREFGKTRYYVTPCDGQGESWVDDARFTLLNEEGDQ